LTDANATTISTEQLLLGAAGNPTLLCILGCHMFFNLKEAGEAGLNEGTNVSSYPGLPTISSIHFDEPNNEDGLPV
jgi:hypothetical protein